MKNAIALASLAAVVIFVLAIECIAKRWLALIVACVAVLILIFAVRVAGARDLGQWENSDPATRAWYQSLMQPDNPAASCCGEADAYWADSFEVDGDKYVAIITDPRDDEPLLRQHVPIGTKIVIPNEKLNRDNNPTGHGVVFLSRGGYVYCYIAPGGV